MNALFLILGIILIGSGIILTGAKYYLVSEDDWKAPKKFNRVRTLSLILGLIFFIGSFSFKIIPTGYTGVRTTFGQISQDTVPHGFCPKIPFVDNITLINNKQQDKKINAQVWGESFEKTPVYADEVVVTYQINPEKSAWIFTNVTDAENLITQSLVSSAIKSAMSELPASEVTVRTKIEPLVKEKLSASVDEKYGEKTIEVLKVVISQMDFQESYNEAIASRSIALQKQAQQDIENQTAVSKAEADKKVALTNAEAKAEMVRIASEAEAEANKLLTESLTEAVLKAKFYDKWDGKLPSVMGENSVITDITASN